MTCTCKSYNLDGQAYGRDENGVTCGATVALDDVRSPLWWAAFLLTLILIGAVSWTWAGEVER